MMATLLFSDAGNTRPAPNRPPLDEHLLCALCWQGLPARAVPPCLAGATSCVSGPWSGTLSRGMRLALTNPDPRQGLIADSLRRGQKVVITGFGTFYARTRQSRKARNPRTGGKVSVPKRRYPAFKAARSLKEALKK